MHGRGLVSAILAALILIAATSAQGQLGRVALYADPAFEHTMVEDVAPGMLTVYVVVENLSGNDGAQFALQPDGFTGVWLSDVSPYETIGASTTGIGIAYFQCLLPPVLVLEATFEVFGTSPACSSINVAPADFDPTGFVTVSTCTADWWLSEGMRLLVNWTEACVPVPVETKSWGAIKALFATD